MCNMNNTNNNQDFDDVSLSILEAIDEHYASMDKANDWEDCIVWASDELLDYSLRGVEALKV